MGAYNPNFRGIGEILVGSEIRAALAAVAEKAKATAEADANTFRSDEAHEHYADAFEVRDETIDFKGSYGPSRRAAAVVVNTRPYAAAIEFGTGSQPARRVLGKALASLEADQ